MTAVSNLSGLAEIIREVKPSIGEQQIDPNHSLVDDLGLDSLDLLQLSRRIRRDLDEGFDLEEWDSAQAEHNRSVGSILAVIDAK